MLHSTKLSQPQLNVLVRMNAGARLSGKQGRDPAWRLGDGPAAGQAIQALRRRNLVSLTETWDGDIEVTLTADGRIAAETGRAPKRYAYKPRTRIKRRYQNHQWRWKRICGAKTRQDIVCIRMALENGRCRNHGGMSSGPQTEEGRQRIAEASRARMIKLNKKWAEIRQAA